MTVEITLQVPEELGEELQYHQGELIEILELGLQNFAFKKDTNTPDIIAFSELLVSQLTPDQVLTMQPSHELQARVTELLERNGEGTLLEQEEAELDRYVALERVISLAKSRSAKKLKTQL